MYHESAVLWYITPKFTGKPSNFGGDAPNFRYFLVHRSHLTIFEDTWRTVFSPPEEGDLGDGERGHIFICLHAIER